ncbi:MAG: hypothetical protein MJ129_04620 [Clostridia bacterium]|nr:hypothetical protein [Clostridia bacterium]
MGLFSKIRGKDNDEGLSWDSTRKDNLEERLKDPCDVCYNKQHKLCNGRGTHCIAYVPEDQKPEK